MPKAKEFYADKLGFKVTIDYRLDDGNWYVTLTLPEVGATITLGILQENMEPVKMSMYFETSDVTTAHQELTSKSIKVNDVQDDPFPGSGVKWINFEDSNGNQVFLVQAHEERSPF